MNERSDAQGDTRLWKADNPWRITWLGDRTEGEWIPWKPHPDDEVELVAAEMAIENPDCIIHYCLLGDRSEGEWVLWHHEESK